MSLQTLTIHSYSGPDIQPFIPDLADLRIRIFRDYPYLYDGSLAYEEKYLQHYADSPQSVMVIAFDKSRVIGASTGMPLCDYGEEVTIPFQQDRSPHDDLKHIFYFGESVLDHAYRGREIGVRFFEHREAHAKALGYQLACFCAVERPDDHPLKPADYQPLDGFWQKRGFQKQPDRIAYFSWKDLDEKTESPKPLIFWMKSLAN